MSQSELQCGHCGEFISTARDWGGLIVCDACYERLDNYDGEPVEFEREMAKKHPSEAA